MSEAVVGRINFNPGHRRMVNFPKEMPTLASVIEQLKPVADDLTLVVFQLEIAISENAKRGVSDAFNSVIENRRLFDDLKIASPLLGAIRAAIVQRR